MALLIRTLLIWLLVLAVPAQGAASASMVFCGPDHQGGEAAYSQVISGANGPSHHADAAPADELDAGMLPEPEAADGVSALEKASQAAKQKCSVCASCCSPVAILTTVPVVPAADSAPTVFPTVVPSVEAFAADGPDRPPRNVLA